MIVNFRNSEWVLNPLSTDLHIYALVNSIRETGLTPTDWNFIAKQLCFIFTECDFATYDKVSGDGEIYLSIAELIECLSVLRDAVTTEPTVDDSLAIIEELTALQTQIATLNELNTTGVK